MDFSDLIYAMKEVNKVHSDEKSLEGNCLSFQKIAVNLF